jgi:hypothetical protein
MKIAIERRIWDGATEPTVGMATRLSVSPMGCSIAMLPSGVAKQAVEADQKYTASNGRYVHSKVYLQQDSLWGVYLGQPLGRIRGLTETRP